MIHNTTSVPKNGMNEAKAHQREIPTRPNIRQDGMKVAADTTTEETTPISLV
jgi:hypothetical protein